MSSQLTTKAFKRLVTALKKSKQTCTVVEQSCGGLISTSIMAQPGASSVYYGGSVPYNTRKGQKLLLNDEKLHGALLDIGANASTKEKPSSEAEQYMQSKLEWTARASVEFCKQLNTDYCIAEGGATGPSFRPKDLDKGFAAVAVAGRCDKDGTIKVLRQELVKSKDANREGNMRLFADAAADLAWKAVATHDGNEEEQEEEEEKDNDIDANLQQQQQQQQQQEQKIKAAPIYLDRSTHLRSNAQKLEEMKPFSKYLIMNSNQILVSKSDTSNLELLTYDEFKMFTTKIFGDDCNSALLSHKMTFLGRLFEDENHTPIFALDCSSISDNDQSSISLDDDYDESLLSNDNLTFVDTRTSAPLFSSLHNELALHATAYAQWQRNNSFCPKCGGTVTLVQGGTCLKCNSCNAMSWPRQDPSMIALISSRDGQRVLLARSKRHPPRLHTVLAGFVEAGETFESAVVRETMEETGIRVDDGSATYVGSQPWPFPQSCMIGFMATADDTAPLNIDEQELVSAGWFDKEVVRVAASVKGATMQERVANAVDPNIQLLIPPKGVIARKLIDLWLEKP